jgi:hypothetical protein
MSSPSIEPNTWLMTNTHLYFADFILTEKIELDMFNMYSLFDLSNLLEAILLADKIVTLPSGDNTENSTMKTLKREDILYELEIKEDIAKVISHLKYSWNEDSIISENLNNFADILCDIFPIDKMLAVKVVSRANEWASSTYRTPSWSSNKGFTMSAVTQEDLSKSIVPGSLKWNVLKNRQTSIEETVTETFVRGILYFMIASTRKLNYYPDSMRIPITVYLNRLLQENVYRFAKKLLLEIDDRLAKQMGSIYDKVGFTRKEIMVPSSFSGIISDCRDRSEIIDRALELRESEDLEKCRRWLAEYEEASRNLDINNFKRMSKQVTLIENPVKYDMESLIISSIPSVTDIVSPNVTKSIDKGVNAGISVAAQKIVGYFRTRNLVFYQNLPKQFDKIVSSREHIERLFGSKLSNKDLQIFKRLKDSQTEYLRPTTGDKTIPKEKIQNSKKIDNKSVSPADELRKAYNLMKDGVISEEEFQKLKHQYMRHVDKIFESQDM